jgi:hypothetical protein
VIPLAVFYVHIIVLAAGFTKRYQEEGIAEGFLAVFFVALIFFVGWSISSFLMKFLMGAEGLGPLMDRDALSLLVLTCGEAVFYFFFLRDDATGSGQQVDKARDPNAGGS